MISRIWYVRGGFDIFQITFVKDASISSCCIEAYVTSYYRNNRILLYSVARSDCSYITKSLTVSKSTEFKLNINTTQIERKNKCLFFFNFSICFCWIVLDFVEIIINNKSLRLFITATEKMWKNSEIWLRNCSIHLS